MMWDEYTPDEGMIKEIQEASEHLALLKSAVDKAQEVLDDATKAYRDFACEELPMLFRGHGIEEMKLSNGKTLKIKTVTKCSLAKDLAKRDEVFNWLKEIGEGNIIQSEVIVLPEYIDKLKAAGIDYDEQQTVNTNTMKKLLLELLGQKGTPARIERDDIPKGCGFYQYEEADII